MSEADLKVPVRRVPGAEPSIIESFGIKGLYGYRNLSLASEYAATVLIARNGTGKTTLLAALDAFLRLQLSRLRNLEFSEINCRIRGVDRDLCLTHNDVIEYLQVPTDGEFIRIASRASIDPGVLFTFLVDEFDNIDEEFSSAMENKVFAAIVNISEYRTRDARQICEKLKAALLLRSPNIAAISETLGRALAGYDIVYLPTYRRVELALRGEDRMPHQRRRRPKFAVAAGSLYTGEIQFGLSDIADRLSDMNQRIIIESNNGYRDISAKIINDLVEGALDTAGPIAGQIPSEDDLQLFFSRIERGRRMGPYYPVSIPNLSRIYQSNAVPTDSGKFLNYFLSRLQTVISTTREVESPVDGFVDSCNKYLLSSEPSTTLGREVDPGSACPIDGKKLCLNKSNLKLHVESLPERRKVSLEALSSGEKQMISLFAKLYLYPGNKIVLVDEPELSLSIDWQREILVDVLNAPLCRQVIAITHSPFVFDNELEPFARSLSLSLEDTGEHPWDLEESDD